jgi:ADP-L-glycero-D-manno-heptose 6-epimerase
MLWLAGQPQVSGIFNLGTGISRSFADLVRAVGRALGKEVNVEFIDMPVSMRKSYQYFTRAEMDKLSAAGYVAPMHTLEDGVADYVNRYLLQPDIYR